MLLWLTADCCKLLNLSLWILCTWMLLWEWSMNSIAFIPMVFSRNADWNRWLKNFQHMQTKKKGLKKKRFQKMVRITSCQASKVLKSLHVKEYPIMMHMLCKARKIPSEWIDGRVRQSSWLSVWETYTKSFKEPVRGLQSESEPEAREKKNLKRKPLLVFFWCRISVLAWFSTCWFNKMKKKSASHFLKCNPSTSMWTNTS